MNPPRPSPRLAPSGDAAAMRKIRKSRFGSMMSTPGSSRTTRSRSLVEVREPDVKASMRSPSGASRRWRTSQLTRVAARPSRGASTSMDTTIRRARRSALMSTGATASGIRSVPSSRPFPRSDWLCAANRSASSAASRLVSWTWTSAPSSRPNRSAAKRRSCSHRDTTSARPLSLARNVPAERDSRTGTHDEPMSEKSSAPDLGCSRYRMSSPRIHAWAGSDTPRWTRCWTATVSTSAHDTWCSATLRSLRLSTSTGCTPGAG